MLVTVDQVNNVNDIVDYHAPSKEGLDAIAEIRHNVKILIITILKQCPPSADRTAAIRKVREAMMTANASIVLEGRAIG
jgi:hypothetical protein